VYSTSIGCGFAAPRIRNVEHGGLVIISCRSCRLLLCIHHCVSCFGAAVYLPLCISRCVSASEYALLCIHYGVSAAVSTVLYTHYCNSCCLSATVYPLLYIRHCVSAAVYIVLCILSCFFVPTTENMYPDLVSGCISVTVYISATVYLPLYLLCCISTAVAAVVYLLLLI